MKIEPLSQGFIKSFATCRINHYVYDSINSANAAMAHAIGCEIRRLILASGRAVGLFSASPSQTEVLDKLAEDKTIQWTRVIGFHTDEFIGLNEDAPQSSRKLLLDRLVRRVPMAEFHGLRGEAANPQAVCENYAALLASRPPDFALLQIGQNGELGLLNAGAADQEDSTVTMVDLDDACRHRQLKDRGFAKLEEVPRRALSLTTRALSKCPTLFASLTASSKQTAARHLTQGSLLTPSSFLSAQSNAHIFLDQDSAEGLF